MATILKCGKCNQEQESKEIGCGIHRCNCGACNVDLKEMKKNYSLKEWLGFNFREYLGAILSIIDEDTFDMIKAKTQEEIKAGKFTDVEVDKLRKVMDKGFQESKSIREIADDIQEKVKPRDLLRMKNGEIQTNKDGKPLLQLSKEYRGISISRTETTRLANLGAIEHFKSKGVQEIVFVASYGQRTCSYCQQYDGKIFPITQKELIIPVHVNCRCTWINKLE